MKSKNIKAADLFCGAGGTSTGLVEACTEAGYKVELTAINHWNVAVATHTANHPGARHLCASLDALNPRDLFKEDELDILWASPECTHHSIARGGKPINDQSRATAWCVVRWAEALKPKVILIENVKEFLRWGPIIDGQKDKEKIGKIFQSWVGNLEALGYRVKWRIMCAADYGDPTTRKRLFIQAVRGKRKILWPEPTHSPSGEKDLLGSLKAWVPARKIIDWSIQGRSVYGRQRPLAEKTMRRIMIGLEKFGLAGFTVHMEHQGSVRSLEKPLPTITTAKGGAMAVAQPYLVKLRGTNNAADLGLPSPAVTAGGQHLGLAEKFIILVNHGNGKSKKGDGRRAHSINHPLGTVTGSRGLGLCQPFIIGQQSGAAPRSVDEPVPTVATAGAISLAEPYLVNYYGSSGATSLNDPLDTVTTKDRFGLCQPVVEIQGEKYLVDILFRMLSAKELSLAQGFPADYQFEGTTCEVVKQIGNAVPKNLAKALVRAVLSQNKK